MLLLTRALHQSIVLQLPNADHIEVYIIDIKNNQVKLGVEAPDNISILKDELFYNEEIL